MPLLNYTTTVPVMRTVGVIQALLVEAGARQIVTEWDDHGLPTGVSFVVATAYGPRGFVLPVDPKAVEQVLWQDRKVERRFKTPEQAERVAWRIVKDWVEAQLAIIRTNMVTLDQVMLSYMTDDSGRTVYDLYLEKQLALTAGPISGAE